MSSTQASQQQIQEIVSANLSSFNSMGHAEAQSVEVYHVEAGSDEGIYVAFARTPNHKSFKIEVDFNQKTLVGVQPQILLD